MGPISGSLWLPLGVHSHPSPPERGTGDRDTPGNREEGGPLGGAKRVAGQKCHSSSSGFIPRGIFLHCLYKSVSPPDCLDHSQQSLKAAGFYVEAALLTGTRQAYNNRLSKYVRWCRISKDCPFTASIARVADFLVHIIQHLRVSAYGSGISHSDWGSAPRAPDGSSVTSNAYLSSLIKGIFNERP